MVALPMYRTPVVNASGKTFTILSADLFTIRLQA
jgi:hypothetical protein